MLLRRSLLLLSIGSLLVATGGCAMGTDSQSAPEATSVHADGLTVLEADESAGKLVMAFRKDGREITFELRLGPKMVIPPDPADVDLPDMEIDARVMDQDGRVFLMQMGGDAFIDASWRMPNVENIDAAARAIDFSLVQDAESELAALKLPASLSQLRLGAIQLARSIPGISLKPVAAATPTPGNPGTGGDDTPAPPADSNPSDPLGGGTLGPQGSIYWDGTYSAAYWDYQIWRKDAFINGSPFDHSAVRLRGWGSSYQFLFSATTCNHGTCAAVSPMTVKCTMAGYRSDDGTHSRYFYQENATTSGISGGCSTSYGAVFDNYKHVCNDDTLLQITAIYYDAWQDTSAGTCSDTYSRYWAPGCH